MPGKSRDRANLYLVDVVVVYRVKMFIVFEVPYFVDLVCSRSHAQIVVTSGPDRGGSPEALRRTQHRNEGRHEVVSKRMYQQPSKSRLCR